MGTGITKYIVFALIAAMFFIGCKQHQVKEPKPRLLITTDIGGDPDDMQSLIRLLLYANEFQIEGFVASASGTIGELDEAVVRTDLIRKIVNAYGKVQPNLSRHDQDYPPVDDLLSVIKAGNPYRGKDNIGEGHLTEGSEWIINKVDEGDQPLNIAIWGGQTDLAQALWQVKSDRNEQEYQEFISKIRVHDIADQDSLFGFIKASHPDLFYILNRASLDEDKRNAVFRGMYLDGDEKITSLQWLKQHVIEDHGALGALYPQKTWTAPNPHSAMKEGDTPSWFYFLNNGLNVPEQPEYGGWGGRFELLENNYYNDAEDSWNGKHNARVTVARWRGDFQKEFAARMDWCLKDVEESNHAPIAIVNGNKSNNPLTINSKAGESVSFDASESYDPDDDEIHFQWMIYPEAGDLNKEVKLEAKERMATLTVPELDQDEEIHLILKVIDSGSPGITSYRRIIVKNQD